MKYFDVIKTDGTEMAPMQIYNVALIEPSEIAEILDHDTGEILYHKDCWVSEGYAYIQSGLMEILFEYIIKLVDMQAKEDLQLDKE